MTQPPRTFTLKDRAPAVIAYGSACRAGSRSDLLELDVSFAGEAQAPSPAGGMPAEHHALPEDGCEQETAAREWLQAMHRSQGE
jgi:hypothetical protein